MSDWRLMVVTALLTTVAWNSTQAAEDLHPDVRLVDRDGAPVVESGKPVSTMKSCGTCHDTTFILNHSYHADAGLALSSEPGQAQGRPWDWSRGQFGRWNPLTYRYLTPVGEQPLDLGTAEWIRRFGRRHVGGGPAQFGRQGDPLTQLPVGGQTNPQTHVLDPQTGQPEPWDWEKSGTVEMNCFLCHVKDPDNAARIDALQDGRFAWANTATLAQTPLVKQVDGQWQWQEAAFEAGGAVTAQTLGLSDPQPSNCGQCHGTVEMSGPVRLERGLEQWSTEVTGQVFSPRRLMDSEVNLKNRHQLSRVWDVHAERLLVCTDCHGSVNNPASYRESERTRPEHLRFTPRRQSVGEYLHRPSHQFAKGHAAQGTVAEHLDGTMRRCEDCHEPEAVHKWLPHLDRHLDALSCEVCHVPRAYAPARKAVDWTLPNAADAPRVEYRGVTAENQEPLVTGYEPVLLPLDRGEDGRHRLQPHNLIASWYWVHGEPARPVPLHLLKQALIDGDGYAPAVVEVLDDDDDGKVDESERVLDTKAKAERIRELIEKQGLDLVRVAGEILPLSLHHGVAGEDWALRDCEACHAPESRTTKAFDLASVIPAGVMPALTPGTDARWAGVLQVTPDGGLQYVPQNTQADVFVAGHDSAGWLDVLGVLLLIGTVLGVAGHTALRIRAARQRRA